MKNERGSTLLLTVLTIALLSVLGTAVLSMSTMNVMMKQTDKQFKNVHYDAEAGIEQAYTIVAKAVEGCITQSKERTLQEAQKLVQDIEQVIATIKTDYMQTSGAIDKDKINTAENEVKRIYDAYIKSDSDVELEIDEEKVQDRIIEIFKISFVDSWNNVLEPTDGTYSLKAQLNDENYYSFKMPTEIIAKKAGGTEADKFEKMIFANEVLEVSKTSITVISTYKEGNVDKTISADITVSMPDIEEEIVNMVQKEKIENIIWKQALVSQKDIVVKGKAKVNGATYAYGRSDESRDSSKLEDFGGLIIKKDGELAVRGDIISHDFVHVENNGQLTVKNSNVYANSLVIREDAKEAHVEISNSFVYTEDDIEHNGEQSTLIIDGVYIGFSDGSSATHRMDKSSSIVINSPDIDRDVEEGSILKITGVSPSEQVKQGGYANSNELFQDVTILVPGVVTVFNGEDHTKDYKTGESVSIKGNYLAYTYEVPGLVAPSKEIDGLKFFESDTVSDKDEYINKFYEKYKEDPDLYMPFYTGKNGLQIYLNKYWYTLGATLGIPGGGSLEDQTITKAINHGYTEDIGKLINEVEKDYRYILNTLAYRDRNIDEDADDYEQVYGIDSARVVEKYIKGADNYTNPKEKDEVNKTILKYSKESISLGQRDIDGYTGIIISEGDITLQGNINFNGVIIAKGNIIIEEGANVEVINNPAIQTQLTQLVNNDDIFKALFDNSFKYKEQVNIAIEDILAAEYANLVRVDNWQQVVPEVSR